MTILFPSSYFHSKKVDEAFQKEYEAALYAGFDILLFDQPSWDNEKKIKLLTPNSKLCTREMQSISLYRGWMMKPEEYEQFYNDLKGQGVCLITSPEEYLTCHCFPHVYLHVTQDTPKIKVYPNHSYEDEIDISTLQSEFDRFFIKDFVKSAKNTNFPKYFDKNTTQEEFNQCLKQFFEIRGSLFTGGIVVKEFVDLKKYADKTNEYRAFYLNGEVVSVSRNSLQSHITPEVPKELVEKYRNLPSSFYTVDFAEKENQCRTDK